MNPTPTPLSADDLATALTNGGAGWLVLSLAAILPIRAAMGLTVRNGLRAE